MTNINYTFIIPHYNIPDLLVRCIESIPNREDIQIVVVDDCSPNFTHLKNKLSKLPHSNVELYTTAKGGSAGRARNIGIEHAKGKWISFIDADDLLSENAEYILDQNKDHTEDVMFFQSNSVMSNDLTQPSDRNIFQYHFDCYFKYGNETLLRYEFDAPWGKFVKKSLIDNYRIRFDEVRYSNDTFFSAAIGVYADQIFVSKDIIYIVTERMGSLTANKMKTLDEWDIRYNSALRVQDFFDSQSIKYRRYAFADFLYMMSIRDRNIFRSRFKALKTRNKVRYIYYYLRKAFRRS